MCTHCNKQFTALSYPKSAITVARCKMCLIQEFKGYEVGYILVNKNNDAMVIKSIKDLIVILKERFGDINDNELLIYLL